MFKIGQRPKVESVKLVQAGMTLITGGFGCILKVTPVRKVSS
jgi:energy-converting hydrogenase Eha subunit C